MYVHRMYVNVYVSVHVCVHVYDYVYVSVYVYVYTCTSTEAELSAAVEPSQTWRDSGLFRLRGEVLLRLQPVPRWIRREYLPPMEYVGTPDPNPINLVNWCF